MTLPSTIASIMAILCLFLAAISLRLSRAPGWSSERWIAAMSLFFAAYIGLDIPITLHVSIGWLSFLRPVQSLAAGAATAATGTHANLPAC
jgi:hypothetical protein